MEIFSLKFLLILVLAVVILSFMARRKRKGPTIIRGKQFSIRGQRLTTVISPSTPLICLLEEGRMFGEDFKDKTPPDLPHTDHCRCELVDTFRQSSELFKGSSGPPELFETDLGDLNRNEYRFYRYWLISHHPEADKETRSGYKALADNITVQEDFKQRVIKQISPVRPDVS